MKRPWINYIVDIGMLIAFILVAITGILKFPGLLKALGIGIRGFKWFLISKIHDWSGMALAVLALVHLILHWNWLVAMTKSLFRGKQ